MTERSSPAQALPAATTAALYGLVRQARLADSVQELDFLLLNDTVALQPYRQAALLLRSPRACALSGVLSTEANAPYVLWLHALLDAHQSRLTPSCTSLPVEAADVPDESRADWFEWWPEHALIVPLPCASGEALPGALLLARDQPWSSSDQAILVEWVSAWWHARRAKAHADRPWPWLGLLRFTATESGQKRTGWRRPRWLALGTLIVILALPVRLTVLAGGELVPAHPAVVRSPMEGVIERFEVQPNQRVQKGQVLFHFDEALIQTKLDVAQSALRTAEAEFRQTFQQALHDDRAKPQLAPLTSRIEERRTDVDYLHHALTRAQVSAPQEGVVLMDEPSEWIGKPVALGERILRIARPEDIEVEAWIPIGDAIPVPLGAEVKLFLHASPLDPLAATLRYLSHEAVLRPDGTYAYRLRATLTDTTRHRVGLKGSAKLYGSWAPLGYWMLRRPLAALRSSLGI